MINITIIISICIMISETFPIIDRSRFIAEIAEILHGGIKAIRKINNIKLNETTIITKYELILNIFLKNGITICREIMYSDPTKITPPIARDPKFQSRILNVVKTLEES